LNRLAVDSRGKRNEPKKDASVAQANSVMTSRLKAARRILRSRDLAGIQRLYDRDLLMVDKLWPLAWDSEDLFTK
jgi:hypothetical protein